MRTRRVSIRIGERGATRAVLCSPSLDPTGIGVVLGHGAGSDLSTPLLVALTEELARRGHTTLRYDYLYRVHGKKLPEPPAVLEETTRSVVDWLRARGVSRLFVGGKSMGGRIASLCASKGMAVDGLVLLGYPLHPAGKPDKLRDRHLPDVACPMLFVQGTRDALCDLALLRPVLRRLGDRATLHVVDGGDHSLDVPKASGRTRAEVHAEVMDLVDAWIRV